MAHRRQWRAVALGGGAPTSIGHGCARGELLHTLGVTVELSGLRKKRQNSEGGPAACEVLRRRWRTPIAVAFPSDEGTTGGNISSGHGSRSRTCNALARREKGGANTEREGSPAMAAKAERAPR
jgi:hypothetical protein